MARHSAGVMEREQTGYDQKSCDSNSARPSVSEIEKIDRDAMGEDSRPWRELRGDEASEMEKTATKSIGGSEAALESGAVDRQLIEMDTVTARTTGPAPGAPGLVGSKPTETESSDHAKPVGTDAVGIEYKAYRRRWFGLLQLTLLNVIVSWDVSGTFPFSLSDRENLSSGSPNSWVI